MPKIDILSSSAQEAFDSPPQFSEAERTKYFGLPVALEEWLKTLCEPTNQVGLILLWGYCQANSRFFQAVQFSRDDCAFVCSQQGIDPEKVNLHAYPRRTFNSHKQKICQHLGLQPFDAKANSVFTKAIQERAARHQSPKQILHEVTEILEAKKIEIPRYNRFALVITKAIVDFEKDMSQLLSAKLAAAQKAQLDTFLKSASPSATSMITWLKMISHSRRPKAIKESMQAFKLLKEPGYW